MCKSCLDEAWLACEDPTCEQASVHDCVRRGSCDHPKNEERQPGDRRQQRVSASHLSPLPLNTKKRGPEGGEGAGEAGGGKRGGKAPKNKGPAAIPKKLPRAPTAPQPEPVAGAGATKKLPTAPTAPQPEPVAGAGATSKKKTDEVGFNTDSRFVDLDDNENDIALDGDARPGDRVLYHFEHVVFGGIINSNGKKIDWDDGDNWTKVKRPKSMQLTKKPLTAMKYGQWAIVRRASSADEPGERASKRSRRAPAAAI